MEQAANPGGGATGGGASGGGATGGGETGGGATGGDAVGGGSGGGGVFDDLDEPWPARPSSAAATLAQVWVGNPASSSQWTSRLAGVE
jgi:hypothetical protein